MVRCCTVGCYQCCAHLAASLPYISVHSPKGTVHIRPLRSILMQLDTDNRLSACHPATNLNMQYCRSHDECPGFLKIYRTAARFPLS